MAVTQYVGARYVPKFYENSDNTSDWRSGVVYEPLTIVTYNGNSYTSKKPVPATVGNPSANLEYWAPTGIYNEQVESLRTDFEELKADTEEAVADMMPKAGYQKAVLLSDSYGVNAATGGTSWIQHMINNYGSRLSYYHAWGGAGFGYQPSEEGYFPAFLGEAEADPDADVVIFLAGANDGNLIFLNRANEQNIYNGLQASVNILKNKYPKARIIIGFVGRYKDPARYAAYKRACEVYKMYQHELGYQYFSNSEYALHDTRLITGADIHPGGAGSEKLYRVARCAIEGRTYHEYASYRSTNVPVVVNVHDDVTTWEYTAPGNFVAIGPDVTTIEVFSTVVSFPNFGNNEGIFKPAGNLTGPAGASAYTGGVGNRFCTVAWHGSNTGVPTLRVTGYADDQDSRTVGEFRLPKNVVYTSDTMLC